ncbi:DUF308 domain-containing protein [Bacillus kexueae]|uniref:DUF308 domain-containing protein n=1 Tax=Aeribacillus kexueae TaxID=2078952 RepID=UPI001FAEC51E|nr:DUF308 domain-containing protein [Bacillus kexueae]
MADERNYDYHGGANFRDENENKAINEDRDYYMEETAAELDLPFNAVDRDEDNQELDNGIDNSRTMGYVGLALSVISLFVLPVLLGAAGIVVGFMARRRGSSTLGSWAIGIGIVSVVLGLFVLPFF